MRPSARDNICAAALESTTATTSASPSAAHRMWRSLRTAASTSSSGTARRAAPRAPPGSASGSAAYIRRSCTVALLRVDGPAPPASAAATSGRSRWFSSCGQPFQRDLRIAEDHAVGADEGDAPVAPAGRARRPARPNGRGRDRSAPGPPARPATPGRTESSRIRSSRFASTVGRRYDLARQHRNADEAQRDREQLAADVELHGSSSGRRRPRWPPRDRAPA